MAVLAELAPNGERRMGANPHANGGLLLKDLNLPDFREYAGPVWEPRHWYSHPRLASHMPCVSHGGTDAGLARSSALKTR